MIILGIGGSIHDFSCSVVKDGEILVAIDEERISKEKNGLGIKSLLLRGVKYCLDEAGIHMNDIDYIVSTNLFTFIGDYAEQFDKLNMINHHIAHCASSFYNSGFDEAAGIVIDGHGSMFHDNQGESISFYKLGIEGIVPIHKILCQASTFENNDISYQAGWHSLGGFYSIISYLCGFKRFQEGKTMGLAPYGKDTYVDSFKKFVDFDFKDGKPNLDFFIREIIDFGNDLIIKENEKRTKFEIISDIAYAGQIILEDIFFKLLNYLYDETRCKKLVFSGGVALNSVMNGKIKRNTPFEEVYIFPSAGDAGTGIGAALYWYYNVCKRSYIPNPLKTIYLGKQYNDGDVLEAIQKNKNKITFVRLSYPEIINKAAHALSSAHIVGWFQGGSEFGPRALGNRSILTSPCIKDMKDILNSRVKFRESFRPYAPVILEECVHDYFDTDFPHNPYMLYVADTKEDKKGVIPAAVHVDGTARFQSISKSDNPMFYDLIYAFNKITNVPILINTSFNIKGKPIVETPDDAIKSFLECDMDDLFVNNYYIKKI